MSAFSTAFDKGVDRIYARMGDPARYYFKSGYWINCTVIVDRSITDFGEGITVRGADMIVSVRVSEVEERPQRGERIVLDDSGEILNVDEVITSDVHEHTFRCA